MKSASHLDLHGVRHAEVETLLERRLLGRQEVPLPFVIVTGNSVVMQRKVLEFLKLHGFNWDRGVPASGVRIRVLRDKDVGGYNRQ